MIRNERQYRITKAQLERFDRTLQSLGKAAPANIHPRVAQAQRDAVQSQVEELRQEMAAYDSLRKGHPRVLQLTSLEELPGALIQGRIAAGLTQRELAKRLGMKEQQLQRYEATNYASASLERIQSIMSALDVRVCEDVFLPGVDISLARILRRTRSAGLSNDLVTKRIAPRKETAEGKGASALMTAGLLNRIFGWAPPVLFGDAQLVASGAALAGARFKLPQNAATRATQAYAAYAYYVASLLLRATPTLAQASIPTEANKTRAAIISVSGELSFASALDYVWSLGVAVLSLADPGAFNAAAWRIGGRNVIVLKHGTKFESRWLYDILHELRHAAEDPEDEHLAFVDYETLARESASSPEETAASTFAGDVLLAGRAEELAATCVSEARGSIERLKAVVPRVAMREGVPLGALANYMAFRLSRQGQSWWGAATNLQTGGTDPWLMARDRAVSRLDLTGLDEAERTVLLRALEGDAS